MVESTRKWTLMTMMRRLVSAWRFVFVVSVFLAAGVTLGWRLVDLHVVDQAFLNQQGEVRSTRIDPVEAHRGMLTDRKGQPLAVSTPVETIWANPRDIDADDPRIARVARVLDISEADLRRRLRTHQNRQFIYVRRKVQPELADAVMAQDVPGFHTRRDYRRYYPTGEVSAHLTGFTNIDEQGQEGIELTYNDWLSGQAGAKRVVQDNRGRVIKDLSLVREAKPGKDLALSIDLRLQYLAYRELKAVVQAHDARSGTLVMLDVDTGEVLAMVNQPSFNPNDRSQLDPRRLRNRAITDLFEPGSTMKPFSATAALETGAFTPRTRVETSPGYLRFGQYTIRDTRNHGELSLSEVISESSNVGMSKVAGEIGGNTIRNLYYRVGFGQATGVGFPGEAVGVLPAPPEWRPVEVATLSYGYGMSVNALQLAQAYMVLANGGVRYPISLLKQDEAPEGERVIPEAVSRQVRGMLRKVVEEGTGRRGAPAIYDAGGKTGTVHLVGAGGYQKSQYKAIFAGVAPADNPRVACVVAVDAPSNGEYYGGEVAAPVFARVVNDALRLMNARPDIDGTSVAQSPVDDGERG